MGKTLLFLLSLVVASFIVHSFIITVASQVIPFAGTFAYPELLQNYGVPQVLYSRANFDGVHYLLIAQHGYMQYQQAFFPLYPLGIRLVTHAMNGNYFISGLFISITCFVAALWLLFKLVKETLPKCNPFLFIVFLMAFPTSFFFMSVYTEGLFLFLLTLVLFFLSQRKLISAAFVAGVASGTRLVGVFAVVPILVTAYFLNPARKISWLMILASMIPFIGVAIYMLYLAQTTGDPLFFLNAQPAFGAMRSNHVVLLPQVYFRYLKIFFTAAFDYHYYIAVVEFAIFNIMLVFSFSELIKQFGRKNLLWVGIGIFSVANLILPTLTGTFSSVPRYSLMSLSAFAYMAGIENKTVRSIILISLALLQAVFLAFFTQGYFVS
ncbi:MAG: hypothetical protein WC775_04065 [Patescibacteria group bacterium]|jgi:hypothetical protein